MLSSFDTLCTYSDYHFSVIKSYDFIAEYNLLIFHDTECCKITNKFFYFINSKNINSHINYLSTTLFHRHLNKVRKNLQNFRNFFTKFKETF